MTGQGLVGKVTFAWGSGATVTLITNHDTELGGTVMETGVKGLIGVDNGHPTSLVLSSLASQDVVKAGDTVVTSGTVSKVGHVQVALPAQHPRRARDARRQPGPGRPGGPRRARLPTCAVSTSSRS